MALKVKAQERLQTVGVGFFFFFLAVLRFFCNFVAK